MEVQKYPSTKGWIKMSWYMHTIDYYSVLMRNEITSVAEM